MADDWLDDEREGMRSNGPMQGADFINVCADAVRFDDVIASADGAVMLHSRKRHHIYSIGSSRQDDVEDVLRASIRRTSYAL